jgi:creatinine amidohydrolase
MASINTSPTTRYWHHLPSAAFDKLSSKTVAILPIGAIEQHGPHLPVWVDSCINEMLLDRALAALPAETQVLALPLQAVGKSNEHSAFGGTLSFSAETLIAMLLELGESVHRSGIKRLVLLNSHGGQPQILDVVARELRIRHAMLVVNVAWFGMGLPEGLFSAEECQHGIHGGEIETSLMLHLRPDLVDMTRARNFVSLSQEMVGNFDLLTVEGAIGIGWQAQDLNSWGVCGNSAAADAHRGAEVAEYLVRRLVDLISEVTRFPLDRFHNSTERRP